MTAVQSCVGQVWATVAESHGRAAANLATEVAAHPTHGCLELVIIIFRRDVSFEPCHNHSKNRKGKKMNS